MFASSAAHEDYNHLLTSPNVQGQWTVISPGLRTSAAERRRQVMREQVRHRALSSRPTSIGSSARFTNPNTSYPNPSQRGLITSARQAASASVYTPYLPVELSRQSSDGSSTSNNGTSSPQEASPAVVVGSGVTTGEPSTSTATASGRPNAFTDHFWLDHTDRDVNTSQSEQTNNNEFTHTVRSLSFGQRTTLPPPVDQRPNVERTPPLFGDVLPVGPGSIFGDLHPR